MKLLAQFVGKMKNKETTVLILVSGMASKLKYVVKIPHIYSSIYI